jgi:mannose-6-phosphate isomerase class I
MINYNIDKETLYKMLLDSIKNKKVLYIKNFTNMFLSWEDFIYIINYQYNNTESRPSADKVINKVSQKSTKISKYTEFHYHLHELTNSGQKTSNIESEFPKVQDFMDYIRESVKFRSTLKALVNIVGNEFTGNRHDDPYHVLSVQHVGSVDYKIFNSDNDFVIYTLEPGDLIFMPSGTVHAISAPNPRVTLTLDIEGLGY